MALDQHTQRPRLFHFDRTVSLAAIAAVVLYFAIGVRWVAGVDNANANIDRRVSVLESDQPTTTADRLKIGILEANLAALKEQVADSRRVLDEIRSLLIQQRTPEGK